MFDFLNRKLNNAKEEALTTLQQELKSLKLKESNLETLVRICSTNMYSPEHKKALKDLRWIRVCIDGRRYDISEIRRTKSIEYVNEIVNS